MKICQAKLHDKKEVLKLVKNLYGKSSLKSVKEWEQNYKKLINSTFVFKKDGKIIAYISYEIRKDFVYIRDLYVLPKFRKQKIATKLTNKINQIKKRLGKKWLRVDVRKKDKPALRLYSKIGFEIWKPKNKDSLKLRR